MKIILHSLLFANLCKLAHLIETFDIPEHYLLTDSILRRYDKGLLPKRLRGEGIKVNFSIELYQLIKVNEPQQFLKINAWIVERWTDDLLGWDPEKYANITELMIKHEHLWIPDTTLYNSLVMDDSESRRLLHAKLTTRGEDNGSLVELLYPTIYQSSCLLNLKYFPFDLQVCRLTFGSWSHDNTLIDYIPHSSQPAIGISNCIDNEGWHVLNSSVIKHNNHYDCCPNNYTLLEYQLIIQRKPLYYIINLITPTAIITLISIIGFFSSSSINDLREEKITLGITTLLSMSILIFMVSDKMPSTSSFIPLIGWFYTAMIFEISVATLCSSVVIYVQKQGMIGKPASHKTMKFTKMVAKFIHMEMPLLMKQAYAKKAEEERARRAALRGRRKKSVWARVIDLAKEQATSRRNSIALQKLNGVIQPEINVVQQLPQRKSFTICNEVQLIDNSDSLHMATEEDTSQIDYVMETSIQSADLLNVSHYAQPIQKSSTCTSIDSAIRDNSIIKLTDVTVVTPRAQQRNLVELEYDWLAAVLERLFFIFFILIFILTSIGINCFGMYFWYYAIL